MNLTIFRDFHFAKKIFKSLAKIINMELAKTTWKILIALDFAIHFHPGDE
jgi:hypothetical protein